MLYCPLVTSTESTNNFDHEVRSRTNYLEVYQAHLDFTMQLAHDLYNDLSVRLRANICQTYGEVVQQTDR